MALQEDSFPAGRSQDGSLGCGQDGLPSGQTAESTCKASESALGHLGQRGVHGEGETQDYSCPAVGATGPALQPALTRYIYIKTYIKKNQTQTYGHVMASRAQRSNWSVSPAHGTPRCPPGGRRNDFLWAAPWVLQPWRG